MSSVMKALDKAGAASAGQARALVVPTLRPINLLCSGLRKRSPVFKGCKKPTLRVQAAEVGAPSRTPRQVAVRIEELKAGDEVEGKVVSVEKFGAFVDFGARTNGLIHISQLSDGFVKNAGDIVQVGAVVKARVLKVDVGAGRIALSLKSAKGRGPFPSYAEGEDEVVDEEAAEEEAVEEVEEAEMIVEEDVGIELEDGFDLIFDENEDIGVAVKAEELDALEVATLEAEEAEVTINSVLVPEYQEVTGTVVRCEDFGAFIEFDYNGRKYNGLLHVSEMKVPHALAEADLAATAPEAESEAAEVDEPVAEAVDDEEDLSHIDWPTESETFEFDSEYVDVGDIKDATKYYKVGDRVSAFVLFQESTNKVELTHFMEYEVETEDNPIDLENGADPLSTDPFAELIEEEEEEVVVDFQDDEDEEQALAFLSDVGEGGEDDTIEEAETDLMVSGWNSGNGSLLLTSRGQFVNPKQTFPSRPLKPQMIDAILANTDFKELDRDDDEVTFQEIWDVDVTVPKNFLKNSNLKMVYENGVPTIVEREVPEDKKKASQPSKYATATAELAASDIMRRAQGFARDLLDDVEEAEVPVRAYRRPVVFALSVEAGISAAAVKQLREKTGAGMMDCKKALLENDGDAEKASEWLRKKGLAGADKKAGRTAAEGAIARYIHPGSRLGVLFEVNCETDFVAAGDAFQQLVGELGMIIASTDVVCVRPEDVPAEVLNKEREVEMGKEDLKSKPEAIRAKIVEGRLDKIKNNYALMNQVSLRDNNKTVTDIVKETIAAVGENIQIRRFEKYRLGEGIEKKTADFAAEVAQQTQAKAAAKPAEKKPEPEKKVEEQKKPTVQVSAGVVKELRDRSGAGMMDCKKALAENDGDMEKAAEWLRKKGLASADKKAGRTAAEGAIVSYIHPGNRLGVMMEVNCETDFVAAGDKFLQLVNSLAMQVAASPAVQYVSAEDIPAEVFEREKQIEMGREDLKSKPEAIRAKIAEGRAQKIAQEMALLPQPYLLDSSKTVADAIREAVATLGEKISIRRFKKFQLGEGIEKKSADFAAEVAAATGKA